MFFDNNRQRMEEDLAKIRDANLPPEKLKEKEDRERASKKSFEENEKFTIKDIFAMSIAIFSLIIPYVLLILAGIGLTLFIFLR